ncbi:MAG: phage holin family protein [Actinomycetaceae bacterium]|nr:phage holin family protein [Actinomycetaceae bacterium]
MRFLFKLIGNMVGLWLASVLVNGIDLPVSDGIPQTLLTLLVIGLVFTLLNMIVRPLLKFLTFPIYVLTLGIFALVVNALIFMLTGWMTQQIGFGLEVSGFWAALFGALVTAIVSAIIGGILDQTAN